MASEEVGRPRGRPKSADKHPHKLGMKNLNAWVEPALRVRLRTVAAKRDISMGAAMIQALEEFCDREEQKL